MSKQRKRPRRGADDDHYPNDERINRRKRGRKRPRRGELAGAEVSPQYDDGFAPFQEDDDLDGFLDDGPEERDLSISDDDGERW